eukprot:10963842-Heterocapsa_arctica.AAC.1
MCPYRITPPRTKGLSIPEFSRPLYRERSGWALIESSVPTALHTVGLEVHSIHKPSHRRLIQRLNANVR